MNHLGAQGGSAIIDRRKGVRLAASGLFLLGMLFEAKAFGRDFSEWPVFAVWTFFGALIAAMACACSAASHTARWKGQRP